MLVGNGLRRVARRRWIRDQQNDRRRLFSDDERKRKALLDALMPSGKTIARNDGVPRKRPGGSSFERTKKQTKPLSSFFAEVDALLAKQDKQHQQTEQPPANPVKWKIPEVPQLPSHNERHLDPPPSQKYSGNSPPSSSYNGGLHRKLDPYNEKSIFEVFKIPEPPPPRSPNAFDLDSYNDFCGLLDAMLVQGDAGADKQFQNAVSRLSTNSSKKEPVLEWIRAEECQVAIELESLDTAFRTASVTTDESKVLDGKKKFSSELIKQGRAFMKHFGWDKDQYNFATQILRRMLAICVDQQRVLPIPVIWDKLKETGKLNQTTIDLTLKGSTTFAASVLARNRIRRSSFGSFSGFHDLLAIDDIHTDASIEQEEEELVPIPEQAAIARDLLCHPTDQTLSIRVRRLVNQGKAQAAEEVIEKFMSGAVKARAYAPVFRLYLELGDVGSAMAIFQKMKAHHHLVPLEPELFVQLIAGIAEIGFFCPGAKSVDGAESLGYSPPSGPALFDQIAREMADYVVSITSTSAKRLQKAFACGFQACDDAVANSHIAPLKVVGERADDGALIVDRVRIDSATGICSRSGVKLRLIGLLPDQKEQMKQSLLQLLKGVKWGRGEAAMLAFWEWLDSRTGKAFTVILDAANVAYYMQNFDQGQFNFHQIQFVVTALEQIGEHPLVLLPGRYTQNSFTLTLGTSADPQVLTHKDRRILTELSDSGKLWVVPPGCLDDYFWILASVSNQTKSCNGKDLQVSHDDEYHRWPGSRPVVVTNDQIRDHQLNLLEPKIFNRWYSNTMVNYNFTGFVNDQCIDPEIGFSPADFFSREIQGNATHDAGSADAWHFPVEDWESTDWFCIRLPYSLKGKPQ